MFPFWELTTFSQCSASLLPEFPIALLRKDFLWKPELVTELVAVTSLSQRPLNCSHMAFGCVALYKLVPFGIKSEYVSQHPHAITQEQGREKAQLTFFYKCQRNNLSEMNIYKLCATAMSH